MQSVIPAIDAALFVAGAVLAGAILASAAAVFALTAFLAVFGA